jgi:hypothetical protein
MCSCFDFPKGVCIALCLCTMTLTYTGLHRHLLGLNSGGGSSNSVSDWPNGCLVQIKKEPVSSSGGSSTPCLQVAEVTTSIRPQQQNVVSSASAVAAPHTMATIVKLEAAPCSTSPCNGGVNSTSANGGPKSMQHLSTNSNGKWDFVCELCKINYHSNDAVSYTFVNIFFEIIKTM